MASDECIQARKVMEKQASPKPLETTCRTPFEGYLQKTDNFKHVVKLEKQAIPLFKNSKVQEGLNISGCSSGGFDSGSSQTSGLVPVK